MHVGVRTSPPTYDTNMHPTNPPLHTSRAKLRWRARRGLLENDLLLTRFLDTYEATLTDAEVEVFEQILDLSDNDLMDLLLERNEPSKLSTPLSPELTANPVFKTCLAKLRCQNA